MIIITGFLLILKIFQVTVETLEKGFLIHVVSKRNYPGLLMAILEATEELGHDVLDARISCEDTFELEAFVGEVNIIIFTSFFLLLLL